jgi:hypothetical protein
MTGFNTEFKLSGIVYHVQTEDNGPLPPTIRTLVYVGGKIVDSFSRDYSDLLADPLVAERELPRRMEEQHRRVLDQVRSGKYDVTPDWGKVDCLGIFGGRPLEEAIFEFFQEEGGLDVLELVLPRPLAPKFGSLLTFSAKARLSASRLPVPGAEFSVRLVSNLKKQLILAEGESDSEGNFEVSLRLPASQPGNCTMLVSCASKYGNDEIGAPITA